MSKQHPRAFGARIVLMFVLIFSLGIVTSVSAQADTETIASPSDSYSFVVPAGWVDQSVSVENFVDAVAFASSSDTLGTTIDFLVYGNPAETFDGVGGMIGLIDPLTIGGQPPNLLVDPLLQSLGNLLVSVGAGVAQTAQPHTFGGQYQGELLKLTVGSIGVMHNDDQLLVAVILTDNVASNDGAINAILESIRIPAASGGEIIPVATVTPEVAPTQEAALLELQTTRSGDLRVSVGLPDDVVVLDHIADADILAFGDSADAAQSRLFSAKPDLATETAITGSGGLIILYPMSQFGIDPATPDLSALMERALGNLQGYTVEEEAQPLESIPNALYAVISGAEHGYLALLPFGDRIAYVTATSATRDVFEQGKSTLLTIVESVRVPAELEPTPAPTTSGLGGLGGLDEEVTPEATPEATAAGIGGL